MQKNYAKEEHLLNTSLGKIPTMPFMAVKKREEKPPCTKPEKICSGKGKKKHAVHPINHPNGEETCLLHGPRNSSEECKVLKD